MFQKQFSDIPLWQFENLSLQKDILHFVSGRLGGVSTGEKGSLNLSFRVGDDPTCVAKNRTMISNALGIDYKKLIIPVQTHSANIGLVETGKDIWEDTDALVTNKKGLCIAVMSADCVPVLFYDPVKKVVAAVHAGWRGTVAYITALTIKKMQDTFNCNAYDIIAAIGPSICAEVYEIGPEVIEEVEKALGKKEGIIMNVSKEGKGYLNLWEANKLQILETGVKPANIEVAGICTYRNDDQFFSARKSKNNTGRFAAGIMLTN